jgi:hypothetical protein
MFAGAQSRGEQAMGKHLCFGEIDWRKMPVGPDERGKALYTQTEMLKGDIEKGIIKDWGDLFANIMDTQSIKELK